MLFGSLREGGLLSHNASARHIPEWGKAKQCAVIKLDVLRAVKDKLPAGQYLIAVTLYDRLGGYPLRWSKLKGNKQGGLGAVTHAAYTRFPVSHEGHFDNLELNFSNPANTLYLAVPAQKNITSSMCFAFELFRLARGSQPNDAVLAWGAFPLCNSSHVLVDGTQIHTYVHIHTYKAGHSSGSLLGYVC